MAQERIGIVFGAVDEFTATALRIKATAGQVEDAFKTLGVESSHDMMQMILAYKTLEKSGRATAAELEQAHKNLTKALDEGSASSVTMGDTTGRLGREMGKLGDISEYAGGGLRRIRNILEGFAFGAVVGAVSAVTDAFISQYKEAIFTREKIEELNGYIMNQASAWKLLPGAIGAASEATVRLYNAELKYVQLTKQDLGEALESKIQNLEKMREVMSRKTGLPFWAGYSKENFAEVDIKIEKARVELEKWRALMNLTPTTVDQVSSSLKTNTDRLKKWQDGYSSAFDDFYTKMKVKRRGMAESQDPSQVWLTVPDYDALAADAIAREQNTIDAVLSARTEYLAQFASAKISLPWLVTEEQMTEMEKARERLFALKQESPYGPQPGEGGQLGGVYDEYQTKLAALQDYNTQVIQAKINSGASQFEIEQEYEKQTTAMEQQEYQMRLGAAAGFSGGMANFFQNLYVAGGKQNKKLFEMGKAFAIGEAVFHTASAAVKAIDAPPGPPWSFAYVAATIAAGMAQIATIRSAQPGGGSISSGGTASPSYSGGSPSAYPVPTRLEETEVKPTQEITLIIQNPLNGQIADSVAENIVELLNRNAGNNYKIDARVIQAN